MQKIIYSRYIAPLSLIILGLLTRFAFIWHPKEVVFDEVHFGKFINGYLTGNYFFDIHPPLGKLILTLGAIIGGFNPEFEFKTIGDIYPGYSFIFLRLSPNLFGALLPVSVYYFVLSIKGSKVCGLLAGLAILFENAILTQSHFILLDSIFLFFSFSGLTLFFLYRQHSQKLYFLYGAGLLLTLSVSIKWTALSFFGLVWIISYLDLHKIRFKFNKIIQVLIYLFVIPFVVYFLIFTIHFAILDKSGPGDAFMSPQFKKTLIGSDTENDKSIKASSNIEKFLELNKTMYYSNQGITTEHPFASRFYLWPIMVKPVYFWYKKGGDNKISRIYLLGNPTVWFTAIFAFILGVIFWLPDKRETKWILYSGWILNMLPFMNIKRPLFLYHYFPALIFSILIMSFFITDKIDFSKRRGALILAIISFFFLLGFLFYSPLSYGLPLSAQSFDLRFWLNLWK
jgi:dolichyl-phosphate-mannose-protein mannosyltransferase